MGIFSIDPYAAGAAFAAFLRRRRGFAAPAFLAAFLRRFGAAFLAAFLRRFGAAFLVVRFFDVFLAAATYFSCQLGSIRHRTC